MLWTDAFLHAMVCDQLGGARLGVVANREPYVHSFTGAAVRCEQPASGMVSALDPVLRAYSGLRVAHGSDNADLVTEEEE
jgi:trehalose 6-phosphate synthase